MNFTSSVNLAVQPQHFSTPARASSTASSLGSSSDSSRSGNNKQGKLSHRQRMAANQRERRRMTSLNVAFDMLRRCLPEGKAKELITKKPISKVETLRLAIDYIERLQKDLVEFDDDYGNALPPSLVPVQGQLVKQLPDEMSGYQTPAASTTPNYSHGMLTPSPPVYCFGGLVQHSVPQAPQRPPAAANTRTTTMPPVLAPSSASAITSCAKYSLPQINYDAFMTPASSFSSPYPTYAYNAFQPTTAPAWYC